MNRIVHAKCGQLQALARHALSGHWAEAVIFVLVCQLIINIPAMVFNMLPEEQQLSALASVINLYSVLINGPIALGMTHYCMGLFRMEKRPCTTEFKFGFHYILRGMVLYVRMTIFTALWSMLFVVPGFIALIRYSQSFMILADDPTKSPARCMAESCFIMRGNKMKFFTLILSFIPWYVLAAVPCIAAHVLLDYDSIVLMYNAIDAGNMEAAMNYAYVVNPIATALEFVDSIPRAYMNVTMIAFFDILCGKLVVETQGDSNA